MEILVLSASNIKEIFTMADAIDAAKDALAINVKGEAEIPIRTNIDVAERGSQSLYMPGYVRSIEALGIKIVSVYPQNAKKGITTVPATMILLDHQTGMVECLMDGTFLTRLRTGAVAGAATDLLAKKDARVMALFGAGGQAESQLEAAMNVRELQDIKVYDTEKKRAEAFAQKMSCKCSCKVSALDDPGKALEDADIITTVTTSREPVFDGRHVKLGAHINAVGSYTPDMSEIDEYTVCNADKVYFDTIEGVLEESGDIIKPMNKGIFTRDNITGELGQVLLGQRPGREGPDEITLFETVGSAVLDIVTAKKIYDKARSAKVGNIITI